MNTTIETDTRKIVTSTESNWVAIDPSSHEVREAMLSRLDTANKGMRSRMISRERVNCEGWDLTEWKPSGIYEWGGEGVANSYRGWATSTLAGLAWFTDAHGRLHIRVYAGRVSAPKSPFGRRGVEAFPHCYADTVAGPICAVYPELRPPTILKKYSKGRDRIDAELLSIADGIAANPTDPAPWHAMADWIDEHSAQEYSYQVKGTINAWKELALKAIEKLAEVF